MEASCNPSTLKVEAGGSLCFKTHLGKTKQTVPKPIAQQFYEMALSYSCSLFLILMPFHLKYFVCVYLCVHSCTGMFVFVHVWDIHVFVPVEVRGHPWVLFLKMSTLFWRQGLSLGLWTSPRVFLSLPPLDRHYKGKLSCQGLHVF